MPPGDTTTVRVRRPDAQRLHALARDQETTVIDFTTTVAKGDAKFEYCLQDPIVIADVATGVVDHTIPTGTCLTEASSPRIH